MNISEYQEQYFKYMYINYQILTYKDVILIISEKFNPNKFFYNLKNLTISKLELYF